MKRRASTELEDDGVGPLKTRFEVYRETNSMGVQNENLKQADDNLTVNDAKLASTSNGLVLPAFPIVIRESTFGEYSWFFCMASGMGSLLDLKREGFNKEMITPKLSARYGIATIYTHKNDKVAKHNCKETLDVTYRDVQHLYGDLVKFSEEHWNGLNCQERFMLAGQLYTKENYSKSDYTFQMDFSFALARFMLACIGKKPSEGCCRLITTMSEASQEFSFTTDEMNCWRDVHALSQSDKMAIFTNLIERKSDFNQLFQILFERLSTYGWSSLHVVQEAMEKLPYIPWPDLTQRWFSGQLEKFQQASLAFKKSKFPALETELLSKHGAIHYRELAAFCAKLLKRKGFNRHIARHAGLRSIRLTQQQLTFIEKIAAVIPEPIGLNESILRAINGMRGIEMSDSEITEFIARSQKACEELHERIYGPNWKTLSEQASIALQESTSLEQPE
ncbi:hypothetical protein DERP_012707 [Dermatophagoides pteronyssinus]|uniref:Uncharacterized protein n=1 Tax=Dermatophagoides pteronyssinus TaxID=6956 RepID=A0ABQ8JQ29_DERPT|nr:hypothetical protein DERP_012707 [Dermatophagoides pteronyssinus]